MSRRRQISTLPKSSPEFLLLIVGLDSGGVLLGGRGRDKELKHNIPSRCCSSVSNESWQSCTYYVYAQCWKTRQVSQIRRVWGIKCGRYNGGENQKKNNQQICQLDQTKYIEMNYDYLRGEPRLVYIDQTTYKIR